MVSNWIISASEHTPDTIEPNTLYLVGKERQEWLALMTCPCGCGDQIMLNLLKDAKPCWNIVFAQYRIPTGISPSINRLQGCKSHFFIQDFKTVWA